MYRSYPKQNLLQITAEPYSIESKLVDWYFYLRFVRGIEYNGSRRYDQNDYVAVKYTLFEFEALAEALIEASKNGGTCNYKKFARDGDKKKVVVIEKGFLNIYQVSPVKRLIGIALTRYEMRALALEMRHMARYALDRLFEQARCNEPKG